MGVWFVYLVVSQGFCFNESGPLNQTRMHVYIL